jgi:hypothetical protein
MLQVFHIDVAKVDRDVAYVASVSEACCKYFNDILQAFVQNVSSVSDLCCKRFYLDVAHASHICYKSMFEMLQLFQSYVAITVFML